MPFRTPVKTTALGAMSILFSSLCTKHLVHTHNLLFSQAQHRLPVTMADARRAFDCRYMLQKNLLLFACNCSKKKQPQKEPASSSTCLLFPQHTALTAAAQKRLAPRLVPWPFPPTTPACPCLRPLTPSSAAATRGPCCGCALRQKRKAGDRHRG